MFLGRSGPEKRWEEEGKEGKKRKEKKGKKKRKEQLRRERGGHQGKFLALPPASQLEFQATQTHAPLVTDGGRH